MSTRLARRVAPENVRGIRSGRRLFALLAVPTAFAVLAGACGDDSGSDSENTTAESSATTASGGNTGSTQATTATTAAATAKTGGRLIYGSNTMAASLDPTTVSARVSDAGMYSYPIFGSLVDVDYETGSKISMNFAKSLDSTDGVVWTLVLNDGIKFSDGEPYNAEAVKFNWDRYLAKAPQKSLGSQKIKTIEVVDPLTVKVTLTESFAQWPLVMGPLVYVGSPKAITELGDKFATAPVGAGPFVLKEWVSDTSMTAVRNPTYWEKGRPYLDELKIINMPDPARRIDALVAGEVDIALGKPDMVDTLKGAGLVQFASPNNPSYGGSGWVINAAKPPLDDKVVRCAVIASLDKDAMNQNLAAGNAIRNADGTVYQRFVHRGPAAEGAKTLPKFDRAAAQAAFDAYAAKTGGPVKFTLLAIDSAKIEAEYFLTQWKTYKNLDVSVEFKTVPETIAVVSGGTHNIAQLGWGSGDVPAGFSITQFAHSKDGKANPWTGFTSAAWDAAMDTYASTTDDKARADALRAAQDIMIDECVYNPIPRATIGFPYGKKSIKNWNLLVYSTAWEDVWLDQ